MKKNSLCCYLLAIASALFIPACGGGGGGGNGTITAQQFESGAAGFAFTLVDTMEIWSSGQYPGSVNSKGEASNWEVPQIWDRDDSSNKVLEGWGKAGDSAERTNLLTGSITIGSHVIRISSMIYTVTKDGQFGHLKMALDQDDLRSSGTEQALANFIGLSTVDQQSTYTGNMLGSLFNLANSTGTERVIVGTMSGCSLEIWIKLTGDTAVVQCLSTVVHQTGENEYGDPGVGAYITGPEVRYTKLVR